MKSAWAGGGDSIFSGRGVWPGFPNCGICKLIFVFQGGTCELKISKFGTFELKFLNWRLES